MPPWPFGETVALFPFPPAHVRWFVVGGEFPLRRAEVLGGVTLLALAVIAVAVGGAWLAGRLAARWRLPARARSLGTPLLARVALDLPRPADLYAWVPAVLALHTAAALLLRGVERQLFVANLALPYTLPAGLLALGEIVVALALLGGLLVGALTRLAAAGLAGLWLLGVAYFGPLLLLEHAYLLGIAAFLLITGPGPGFGTRLVRGPGRPLPALLPAAMPLLLGSFGFATMLTGFTEKLWNRDLALAFLRDHPFNLTAATPFAVGDAHFIVGAGLAEAALGAVLLAGLWPRAASLAAWVPFNLAVPFLGRGDVVGHLPIYGILLVVLLCGAGRGFAAALRRDAAVPPMDAPPPAIPWRPRATDRARARARDHRAGRFHGEHQPAVPARPGVVERQPGRDLPRSGHGPYPGGRGRHASPGGGSARPAGVLGLLSDSARARGGAGPPVGRAHPAAPGGRAAGAP